MDYFLVRQTGTAAIPGEPKSETQPAGQPVSSPVKPAFDPEISIRPSNDITALEKFDFIASETLVSDRLKLLLEQYLPEQKWKPCVFIDQKRTLQKTFWFLPPLPYMPQLIKTSSAGIPAEIHVPEQDFAKKSPGIFCIRGRKGPRFLIVHLSIAESILRRGICGLELVPLSDI